MASCGTQRGHQDVSVGRGRKAPSCSRRTAFGTATAASLWVTGAVGVAAGLGSYDVAVVLTAFTLLTFWVLAPLKPAENERDEDDAG